MYCSVPRIVPLAVSPMATRRVVDGYRLVDLRQPEVEQLHPGALGHQNIGRLQIAMRDSVGMRRIERRSNLPCILQRLVQRQRTLQRRPSTYSITR